MNGDALFFAPRSETTPAHPASLYQEGDAAHFAPAPPPIICARELSRAYRRGADQVQALKSVSVDIQPGCFVVFMGPSGSGKSTLLNLIAGLDRPDSGSLVVAGERLDELSEDELARWRAAHIGFVFQFFNLIPVLTALENVALPLLLTTFNRRERQRRAEIALRVVGLTDRLDHKPNELSGGEQQRVAIARAIVGDPDLIVADEPTGDLDARNAEEVLALLRNLKENFGKTVVMVSHDPRALRFVDEALHLDKGVLLEGEAAVRAHEAILLAAGGHGPVAPATGSR